MLALSFLVLVGMTLIAEACRAFARPEPAIGVLRLGSGNAIADTVGASSDAVEDLALAHPHRTIEHRHAGEAECRGDCDRLAQLVGNLVSNALAYGREEAAVAVLSSVREGMASIAVRNWGAPIPEPLRAQLFQPMVRGEVDASSRSVGLGLYIVSEIAKAHGGAVAVESELDSGTVFTMSFPSAA